MNTERGQVSSEAIAQRLRQARAMAQASGEPIPWTDVAKKAGVGYRTLCELLARPSGGGRGRSKRGPTLDTLARVACVLSVRAGWLAFGEEEGDHGLRA